MGRRSYDIHRRMRFRKGGESFVSVSASNTFVPAFVVLASRAVLFDVVINECTEYMQSRYGNSEF